ncbi:MAG: amidohydrolase family protein [Steroidobacteraceae bacterium]
MDQRTAAASDRLVCITSDAHIGTFAMDFEKYLDPDMRPAYRERYDAMKNFLGANGEPDVAKLLAAMGDNDSFNIIGEILRPDIIERQQADRRRFLMKHFGDEGALTTLSTGGEGDPKRQVRELEADGTVGGICLPQASPFGFGKMTPAEAKAGADAVNRWVADFVSVAPDRHAGAFTISLEAGMDVAIEQVKWCRKNGLRGGLLLDTNPEVKGLPLYNARYWDPLWEVCADHDVVVNLHAGAGPRIPQRGAQVLWTIDNRWFMSRPLRYFIMGGVFDRCPKLKVMFIECNASWAIEEVRLLDAVCSGDWERVESANRQFFHMKINHDDSDVDWKVHMLRTAKATLKKAPSEYCRSNVWFSITASPEEWDARKYFGADRLLWGSDYPHNESTWPHSMEQVKKTIDKCNVSKEDARQILGANAAKLWEFDLAKLQPIADRVGPSFN